MKGLDRQLDISNISTHNYKGLKQSHYFTHSRRNCSYSKRKVLHNITFELRSFPANDCLENTASHRFYTVSCISIAANMCLACCCLPDHPKKPIGISPFLFSQGAGPVTAVVILMNSQHFAGLVGQNFQKWSVFLQHWHITILSPCRSSCYFMLCSLILSMNVSPTPLWMGSLCSAKKGSHVNCWIAVLN
jgi:hypothetical protein